MGTLLVTCHGRQQSRCSDDLQYSYVSEKMNKEKGIYLTSFIK